MATAQHEYSGVDRDAESERLDGAELEKAPLPEPEWKPGRGEYAVMLTLAVISLMVSLDATILVPALPALAVELGGTATDAFWAGTSYLLTCAVCQPFIAALSDIFGRKELLIFSIAAFTLGTLLCAPIAKSFTVMFAGRAIQGIGGGGIITLGQVIFADIVPLRQRPKYFSIVMAAWAIGTVIGPLVGGLFVEHSTWRWCFYINFPFCALGLVLVPLYVKLSTAKTSLVSRLARVDWLGGFLFIGSMTSLLIGVSWAGVQFAWSSAQTIAPMVVGGVGIVVSILWEIYGAREPFLRPSLFNSVSALVAYTCALLQGFILFCALYYLPFYFTAARFETPTQSGLDLFPVSCFLLPGSIVVSLITTRTGHYRWAIWIGWAVTAAGCGLLVLLDAQTITPLWVVIFAVFGIGNGMLLTSVNVGIQAVSRVEDAGRAAAMYAFMRTLGMSIGVAVGGTVFQNVMIKKLDELGLPEEIAHNSEAFVAIMARLSPEDPLRINSVQAYLAGFHGVYWAITGAAIAGLAISLLIRRHSMDKDLDSEFTLKGGRTSTVPLIPASSRPGSAERIPPDMSSAGDMQYDGSPFAPVYFNNSNSHGQLHVATQRESTDFTPNLHYSKQYSTTSYSPLPQESDIAEEAAAVAYYIEPGGRMVPVDISSSTAEHNMNWPTGSAAPSVHGVHVHNEVHVYDEPVQPGRIPSWMPGPGLSQPGLAGHEAQAVFTGQGGVGSGWMAGR